MCKNSSRSIFDTLKSPCAKNFVSFYVVDTSFLYVALLCRLGSPQFPREYFVRKRQESMIMTLSFELCTFVVRITQTRIEHPRRSSFEIMHYVTKVTSANGNGMLLQTGNTCCGQHCHFRFWEAQNLTISRLAEWECICTITSPSSSYVC